MQFVKVVKPMLSLVILRIFLIVLIIFVIVIPKCEAVEFQPDKTQVFEYNNSMVVIYEKSENYPKDN